MHKILNVCLLLSLICSVFSCKKNGTDVDKEDPKKDKWLTQAIKDSSGNQYFVAATYDNKLQIRVNDAKGNTIFSADCPTIESEEIPASEKTVAVALTAPNKYINKNDASLSIGFSKGEYSNTTPYVRLLANISLDTKTFYTKKYKVAQPLDWSFVMSYNGVVQWNQSSILVREGTEEDLSGGGFMGLGTRGRQLVCYNRDFSVRYTKDIDVTMADYPSGATKLIPINNTEYIAFGADYGTFGRYAILVSVEDEWAGIKPKVWQVDLKKVENLSADYSVKIADYSTNTSSVKTTYSIFDAAGKLITTKTREWDIKSGAPLTQLKP